MRGWYDTMTRLDATISELGAPFERGYLRCQRSNEFLLYFCLHPPPAVGAWSFFAFQLINARRVHSTVPYARQLCYVGGVFLLAA